MDAFIWPIDRACCCEDPSNILQLSFFGKVSQHHDVLSKRLALDSTDRESHFLSRFENVGSHNVRQNEGNLGAVRAINNSKTLNIYLLDDSYHFNSSA